MRTAPSLRRRAATSSQAQRARGKRALGPLPELTEGGQVDTAADGIVTMQVAAPVFAVWADEQHAVIANAKTLHGRVTHGLFLTNFNDVSEIP